jgi:putative endonuclease
MRQHWFVYVLRCSDGSLYAGVASNVENDLRIIKDGGGSAWLRARTPVFLAYTEEYMNESDAEKRAAAIRRMKREYKERLLVTPESGAMPEWGMAAAT